MVSQLAYLSLKLKYLHRRVEQREFSKLLEFALNSELGQMGIEGHNEQDN